MILKTFITGLKNLMSDNNSLLLVTLKTTGNTQQEYHNTAGLFGSFFKSVANVGPYWNTTPYDTPKNNTSYRASYSFPVILVGSGTTAPTADDYKLENFIADIRYMGCNCSDYGGTFTITNTIQNITENDVTINEVGLHAYCNYASTYPPSYSTFYHMLTREVLPAPIILKAGETRVFSISINLNDIVPKQ